MVCYVTGSLTGRDYPHNCATSLDDIRLRLVAHGQGLGYKFSRVGGGGQLLPSRDEARTNHEAQREVQIKDPQTSELLCVMLH